MTTTIPTGQIRLVPVPPKKRVLIIDDEPEIRDSVRRWLEYSGFATLLAEDGDDGISAASEQLPDAIILDMRMPRKDGLETLTELRANTHTFGIPVVMLSASLRDQQRALDAGAAFFVEKPYDGKKLVSTVTVAIEQSLQRTTC